MKLIVYILSALLLTSYVSAGGTSSKQEIPISEIEKDSNLKDALKYGINWIFQQAADKYGTSPANIEVTQVNSIYRWAQNKDTYYSFDVEATNNNDAWINGTYTVRCNSAGEKVTKWKYHIEWNDNGKDNECEVPDAGENVEIDVEVDVETTPEEDCETPEEGQAVEVEVEHDTEVEIEVEVVEEEDNNKCKEVAVSEVDNDSELKKALVYGINWIYQQAADKYGTSASNVEVTKINSICKWKEDSNTYYTFTVESTNNNDAWINGTYTVRCNSSGEKVVKWKYHIEWKDNGKSDEEECETPNGGQEVEVEVEHDTEVEVEGNSECEEENTGTNVEVEVEHDVEVEVEQPNDGYYELSNSDCEDEQIRDIIDEAIDYVTCQETEKIPKDDYYLKKIVSAYKKETSNADYYKFEVDVENKDGSTEIDLKFTSEVQGTTYNVKTYWFHIST